MESDLESLQRQQAVVREEQSSSLMFIAHSAEIIRLLVKTLIDSLLSIVKDISQFIVTNYTFESLNIPIFKNQNQLKHTRIKTQTVCNVR